MKKFLENLKKEATEKPVEFFAAATAVITVTAAATAVIAVITQLSKVANDSRNSRAWKKEVQRRIKNSK